MRFNNLINMINNKVKGSSIPTEDVASFFILYVSGIGIRESARNSGLNESTCRSWRKRDWWDEVEAMARNVASQNTDRKFSKIIEKAMGLLETRLDKGDPYTFQGKLMYRPVVAKDLAWISGILFDKRALVRGEATSISGETKTEAEKLRELSKTFEKISVSKPELKIVKEKLNGTQKDG